jgi:hypothetical protein
MEGVSRVGVSLPEVGVAERFESLSGDFSGDRNSNWNSLFVCGVDGRPALFSGDLGELKEPPSNRLLKSLTFPV